jgi:hypothetical protein
VIEPELTLLQMQVERRAAQAAELHESGLCHAPEALYPIDVAVVNGRREHRPPVLSGADDVIHQDRDVMALVDELAHPHTLTQQAAGNVPAEIHRNSHGSSRSYH